MSERQSTKPAKLDIAAVLAILGIAVGGIALAGTYEQPALAATFTSIQSLTGAITFTSTGNTILITTVGSSINFDFNLAKANTWTAIQSTTGVTFDSDKGFRLFNSMSDAFPTISITKPPVISFGGAIAAPDVQVMRCGVGCLQIASSAAVSPVLQVLPDLSGSDAQLTLCAQNSCANSINFQETSTNAFMIFSTVLHFRVSGVDMFQLTTTGVGNSQGFQSVIAAALGNPSTSTTITLPVAEPDTTYAAVCTGNFAGVLSVSGKTTTNFVVNYPAITVGTDKVDCIVTHQ